MIRCDSSGSDSLVLYSSGSSDSLRFVGVGFVGSRRDWLGCVGVGFCEVGFLAIALGWLGLDSLD